MAETLTPAQARVIEMMRADAQRDLYEIGDAATNMKTGAGLFAVTHTADEEYEYLAWPDVNALVALGLIQARYPSCYRLAGDEPKSAPTLRRLRQERGCNQTMVVAEAGVTVSVVSAYERGKPVSAAATKRLEAWMAANSHLLNRHP